MEEAPRRAPPSDAWRAPPSTPSRRRRRRGWWPGGGRWGRPPTARLVLLFPFICSIFPAQRGMSATTSSELIWRAVSGIQNRGKNQGTHRPSGIAPPRPPGASGARAPPAWVAQGQARPAWGPRSCGLGRRLPERGRPGGWLGAGGQAPSAQAPRVWTRGVWVVLLSLAWVGGPGASGAGGLPPAWGRRTWAGFGAEGPVQRAWAPADRGQVSALADPGVWVVPQRRASVAPGCLRAGAQVQPGWASGPAPPWAGGQAQWVRRSGCCLGRGAAFGGGAPPWRGRGPVGGPGATGLGAARPVGLAPGRRHLGGPGGAALGGPGGRSWLGGVRSWLRGCGRLGRTRPRGRAQACGFRRSRLRSRGLRHRRRLGLGRLGRALPGCGAGAASARPAACPRVAPPRRAPRRLRGRVELATSRASSASRRASGSAAAPRPGAATAAACPRRAPGPYSVADGSTGARCISHMSTSNAEAVPVPSPLR